MSFPEPPFSLSLSDRPLIRYLKKKDNFSYLSTKTYGIISKLKNTNLFEQNDLLIDLWPNVLTDSLRKLKENDRGECDKTKKKIHYLSFFHERSLGVDQLKEVLTSFTEFEGLLYGASPKKYRDHIAHVFKVWIIGQGILAEKKCFNRSLETDSEVGRHITRIEWDCMWAITALCHDLGYPLSQIEIINNRARESLNKLGLLHSSDLKYAFSNQMVPFHDAIIKIMASTLVEIPAKESSYATHLQNKYYLKLLKSFDNLDHGIVSSLLISKSLVYFLETDFCQDAYKEFSERDAKQFLIRREILRSIAAHTCQDIYHLKFNTISFLLYLVDEIQCWGRPTLEQLQHKTVNISEAEAEIKEFNSERISILIRTNDPKWVNNQLESATFQLNKLHRMLRLAVDTKRLEKLHLQFAILPKQGKGVQLLLDQRKIKINKVNVSNYNARIQLPSATRVVLNREPLQNSS